MKTSQLFDVMPGMYIFKISGLEFCVNVRDVYIVKRLIDLDHRENILSNGYEFLNFYNINIPVVDISKYFDISDKQWTDNRMVLILRHAGEKDYVDKTYGIMADEVTEIISIDKKNKNMRPKFVPAVGNPFLSGSVFFGEREILLPDFLKIASSIFMGQEMVQPSNQNIGN